VRAGQPNARFLDAQVFKDFVLAPCCEAKFGPHTGPFIFEFQRQGMSTKEFCSQLDKFFGELPKDFRYAVEIWNAGLLGADYHKALETNGVAHVHNHWSHMPPLVEQHKRMETFTAPFTVLRLLTPLKISYISKPRNGQNRITRLSENSPRSERIQWNS